MASYDVMPYVQLYQPAALDDALQLAGRFGRDGWILGGGQDTYGWLKDRAKKPKAMIDLNGIDELRGVRQSDAGIEIGAATTLREIIRDPVINAEYALLAQTAGRGASPRRPGPRRLPGPLVDRMYEDLDKKTRRAILRLYRSADDPAGEAPRLVEALRPLDRPALVIWGEHDPYVPAALAERQRQAFPSAEVHVLERSGHWPFVDSGERVEELLLGHLRRVASRTEYPVRQPA